LIVLILSLTFICFKLEGYAFFSQASAIVELLAIL
jgi:hypothetical protein